MVVPTCLLGRLHPGVAYLRHLFRAGEMLALRLLSFHNLDFYLRLMRSAREAISAGNFVEFQASFCERYNHQNK